MMFLFWLIFFLFIGCIVYLSRRYRNPYKLIMIFGKKGSGKTTLLAKIAVQNIRKGRVVYSTFYVPGVRLFEVQKIGEMDFGQNAVIIVDEVGMIWDNRNFKNFRTDVRDWFKLQRQYKNTVYLASQTFDIDVKLRNLTDRMYLCKCHMSFLSVAKRIKRDIVLVQPSGDSEARIADSLEFEPFFLSLFGAQTVIFTYIPKWSKVFKSFNPKELPPMEYEYQKVPDHLKGFYHVNKLKRKYKKKKLKIERMEKRAVCREKRRYQMSVFWKNSKTFIRKLYVNIIYSKFMFMCKRSWLNIKKVIIQKWRK